VLKFAQLMPDLYGRVLRNLLLPLGDRLRGIPIGQTLELLENSQYWDRGRLEAYRDAKLRLLVDTAWRRVPHYRDQMHSLGVAPGDIQTASDLHKLPVLTRSMLRSKPIEVFCNSTARTSKMSTVRTGGSTGEPLTFRVSKACRAFDRATLYRLYRWCGIDRGDPVFSVWGNLPAGSAWQSRLQSVKRRYISRIRSLDAFQMNAASQRRFIAQVHRGGTMVLRGYTSALVSLAQFAEENGCEFPHPIALVTTAEPLFPRQRQLLSRAFGAPVHDQYGCAEVNGVAMQCEQQDGMHIAEEHVVVEILDDNDQPVPPGVAGRIVLTNLDNEVMPFIRYDSGDIGALRATSCPCGRSLALMEPVQGRAVDMIHGLSGNKVYGTFFYHVLNELGWFEQLTLFEFQVIQTAADKLVVLLVSGRPPQENELRGFIERVQESLGPMDIQLRQMAALQRSRAGKLRYTVRQWHTEDPG
jgi:phenylacetate-CoA ligase